ncbi:hypothetical protein CO112_03025 [Candidatus Dojkabacteria bacterium CG_4_9_14_3_um_filter_150_Dojkabacteria_WS6_41_13]|uniref:Baseplate protein J-like barrel domain-containing protein n=1 Tax=Candidatus Dojkabacteria bacterium CG_4_10_14_0_2_um_filter_Dojkabacteria_WS6_41_15 TaxID=2014249 RepID=A0A2M7W138_9BACT|nr:MAG: hypothetical protein COZ14_04625 [Candidatus Dojkabacteria bacterium CG_4_10_14_3_um_filter_Dojkabacteria_WS6_41_9]PJA12644.1 MAG: hypothetical protein COX64_04415 [Candidatus Dojkabacteria bacterium CG_4_10_14_0_2_um_filter_Dojkabacteria_WS6_41_15]PJB22690.1 MAG: hypothetical protein CO112_03025 [Candidatus Dojkabacteria bacterium CG_4_9_14_3_um_filter_150_Dojkabacteria_WS6_41_13]
MIDATPDKKVVKINVTIDDDINLILDAIIKVDAAFVMLVLPEGNDLANSPIGLKALRKKTLEKGKRMVLVVPQGIGYELAKKAGFIASTSQDAVTGDVWQTVVQQFDEYKNTLAGMNSQKELPHHIEKKVEYMTPVPDHLPIPEIVTGGGKVINEEEASESTNAVKQESTKMPQHGNSAETTKPEQVGDNYENSEIPAPNPSNSKEPITEHENSEKPSKLENLASQNVTGIDFSKMMKQKKQTSFFGRPKAATGTANTIVPPQEINSFHPDVTPKKVGSSIAKVSKKGRPNIFGRIVLFIFFGALIAAAGMFSAYYYYFPKVHITIAVQSSALTITDSVLATSAVTGFDINRKEIQMTKEKVEKNGTLPFKATESGTDGTKATGTITVINSDMASKTVPVGTLVTSGGKKFVVTGAAVVVDVTAPMTITASEFGEEYNLPADNPFVISGFPTLSGQNSVALSGGTKRTFVVVGQKDVDKAVKALQTQLGTEAESDLSYMNLDNNYEFIKSSVVTTLKGKPTANPAVGAEVKETDEEPSVALFTTTTALYYHAVSLSQLAEQMLLNKYKAEKNLSAADASRVSIEKMSVKADKVTVAKDDKVTVEFTANGLATSRLDIDKIRNEVTGKKWPEMLEYLSKLPSLEKAPEVKFAPVWLPDWARYVPGEVSRIDVRVNVVAPTTPIVP